MNTLQDDSNRAAGVLIFDLKCRLLYSNYGGRLLYRSASEPVTPLTEDGISFEIKRLCFRLKKIADSQSDEAEAFEKSRLISFATTSHNVRHRVHGSLIADEANREPCILIQLEVEEQRESAKLNLSRYQSTYRLTRREIQILELLSKGASYKEIGYTLTISSHTVRDHIKNIRFKLSADGKCGIMARLIEDAGIRDHTNPSSAADSVPCEVPLPHLGFAELREPVSKTIFPAIGKAVLATVDQAKSESKARKRVVTAVSHPSRTGYTDKIHSTETWRLTAKRDAQPRGRAS